MVEIAVVNVKNTARPKFVYKPKDVARDIPEKIKRAGGRLD
jgi:hypothetical protein